MTVANRHIDPIETGEMPGGLLAVARPLPADADWKGGVTFTPQCGTSGIWSCFVGGEEKTTYEKPDPVRFDPFLIYAGATCEGGGTPSLTELEQHARDTLLRSQSMQLARQLVISDPNVDSPDLTTVATDITPLTGPTGLKNSIAGLLSALANCGGGEAVLHVPVVALPYLIDNGLVERDGRYWFGVFPVSVDHYPNLGGLPPASSNEAYLYLTRPVEYEMTGDGEIQFNHYTGRTNEAIAMAEKLAILRFDPCCAYAINTLLCDSALPEAEPPSEPFIEEVIVIP